LIKQFHAASTKGNFKFFCDKCLTNLEVILAGSESQKINTLEMKVGSIENKLDEITTLLKCSKIVSDTSQKKMSTTHSIWQDKNKLASIKAPPEKSVLVLKNTQNVTTNESNQTRIEKAIMDNNIPVSQSYKNKSGDTVIVCESKDTRDELKNLVSDTDEIVLDTPQERRPSITIVGLPRECTKEEVIQMLEMQNGYIKQFTALNDLKDHIQFFSIRPLKNNADRFQVFANVSNVLRAGFRRFNDKVTLGLTTCRVYDRFHVKRCNICQKFGHYARDCPTPNEHVCGKCSSDHLTKDYTSLQSKCINCLRNNSNDINHTTTNFKCPSLISQQDVLKNKLNGNRLNLIKTNQLPPR
jgi:hypothetical protein